MRAGIAGLADLKGKRLAVSGSPVDKSFVILSAAYALWLYRRVVYGALTKDSLKAILDLDRREAIILVPLVILTPVPLTFIGILGGHWLFGAPFSATSMIGFIALYLVLPLLEPAIAQIYRDGFGFISKLLIAP